MNRKKKSAAPKEAPPRLLREQAKARPWGSIPQGTVTVLEWTGKTGRENRLSWRIRLPWWEENFPSETRDFFLSLGERYLMFLQGAGEGAAESLFGGLEFQKREGGLLFLSAFGPFSQRKWVPCLALSLNEKGEIQALKLPPFSESPTPRRFAKGNPEAKGKDRFPPSAEKKKRTAGKGKRGRIPPYGEEGAAREDLG